jgi:cupin superfamily acireductone dioxygenase involved in methionine salvage
MNKDTVCISLEKYKYFQKLEKSIKKGMLYIKGNYDSHSLYNSETTLYYTNKDAIKQLLHEKKYLLTCIESIHDDYAKNSENRETYKYFKLKKEFEELKFILDSIYNMSAREFRKWKKQ